MMKEIQNKGDLGVDELDQDFIDEVSNMRMEIAYKRLLKTRTHIAAQHVRKRDDAIDVLYENVVKECTEAGQKVFREYADQVAYRESEDADFFYKTGFSDGVQLMFMLQKMTTKL